MKLTITIIEKESTGKRYKIYGPDGSVGYHDRRRINIEKPLSECWISKYYERRKKQRRKE